MSRMGQQVRQRVGVMGGSFDPPHIGHLLLAQDAQESLHLDRVVFVPAATAPLKPCPPVASAEARLAMVRAAVAGRPAWEVSAWEHQQGGTSYSLHTACHLHEYFHGAELLWIIGADQLAQLHAWHRIGELAQRVTFAVACRLGSLAGIRPAALDPAISLVELPARRMDISSTEIRQRLAQGAPVDLFLPPPLPDIIRRQGLYRP
ncbi:MAG: nicotinate-nucleotide adenylyltransferase [Puniceicoccales bacterium]|jgi:nicotinate-nucleotide adenylyltransferase|nr:nicotinate-nucleotide adenylyltransferase [Puniceicoccales bacterium]